MKKASSTNGASLTECWHVEECIYRLISITLHKTQIQIAQRHQRKTRYTEPNRRESEE